MTKVGDLKRVNGAKDRTVKVDEDRILKLIEVLRCTLIACTALDHMRELQGVGKEVPEIVEQTANELSSTVPALIALELVFWRNEVGGSIIDVDEFGMIHQWIKQIDIDSDEDDEDE